jgi:hypothetical protein
MTAPSLFRSARLALLPLWVFSAFVHAQPAVAKEEAAAEIAKLEPGYKAAMEGIKTEQEKWEKALETWYVTALEKVLADRAQAGDLDGAVATKAERERMASHAETTAEHIQKMPPALRAVRTTYEASRKQIAGEVAKRTAVASQKYLADLDALQKRLTQQNVIDEALLVKAEKARFSAVLAGGPAIAATVPAPAATPATAAVTEEPKPATPASADPAKPSASEVMTALVGRWRLTNPANGWSGTRTFKSDGSFETETNTPGKWVLDGDRVLMIYEKGGADQMVLPLDPKDTKVKISRGRTIGAVKEANE